MTLKDKKAPKVMIVGAGVGGILLGILLDRIHVPYQIFERAQSVKPLGSVMSLNANVLSIFEQLGILKDFYDITLPCTSINMINPKNEKLGSLAMQEYEEITGFPPSVFARPDLYKLLLAHIPPGRILFGKKVMSIEYSKEGAMIRCSDNSHFHGDILVGADGAHSGVRQSMYEKVSEKKKLPPSDKERLAVGYVTMVGVSDPVDPERYPQVKDPETHFLNVIGGNKMSWRVITIKGHRICWGASLQLTAAEGDEQVFRNSEWGPEAIDGMMKDFEDCPNPFGGKMGDIMALTNKDNISKVFLEDKFFETWTDGRAVLIGDACHKMLPFSGQGAINAMQDAIVLANCIYELGNDTAVDSVKAALQSFVDQRQPAARMQFETSQMVARLMNSQNLKDRLVRSLVFNWLPDSIQINKSKKMTSYRPQACFLPLAVNRGTYPVQDQFPSARRAREEAEKNDTIAV